MVNHLTKAQLKAVVLIALTCDLVQALCTCFPFSAPMHLLAEASFSAENDCILVLNNTYFTSVLWTVAYGHDASSRSLLGNTVHLICFRGLEPLIQKFRGGCQSSYLFTSKEVGFRLPRNAAAVCNVRLMGCSALCPISDSGISESVPVEKNMLGICGITCVFPSQFPAILSMLRQCRGI